MGPDGITVAGGVYVTPADGDKVIARPGTADTTAVDTSAGDAFVSSPSIVQVPGQNQARVRDERPLRHPHRDVHRPRPRRDDAHGPGPWTVDRMLPDPEPGIREPRLTAGPGGVWLSYEQQKPLDDHVLVRRFDPAKNTFGSAKTIESDEEIDSGLDDASSGQDPAGRLHVVWRTDLQQKLLRYAVSTPSGAVVQHAGDDRRGRDLHEPGGRGGRERRRLGRLAGPGRRADSRAAR